jgi:hypothetical protein
VNLWSIHFSRELELKEKNRKRNPPNPFPSPCGPSWRAAQPRLALRPSQSPLSPPSSWADRVVAQPASLFLPPPPRGPAKALPPRFWLTAAQPSERRARARLPALCGMGSCLAIAAWWGPTCKFPNVHCSSPLTTPQQTPFSLPCAVRSLPPHAHATRRRDDRRTPSCARRPAAHPW